MQGFCASKEGGNASAPPCQPFLGKGFSSLIKLIDNVHFLPWKLVRRLVNITLLLRGEMAHRNASIRSLDAASRTFVSFYAMSACFPVASQLTTRKDLFMYLEQWSTCGEGFSAWGCMPYAAPLGLAVLGGLEKLVPSCLAPARANTDQPPLAPPVLAIPASLAAGGAGRRGAKAHDAQPIALRRLRGPTQWERGTSSPLLPIPSFLLSCSSSSLSSPLCGQGQPKTPRGGISAVCTHTRTRS